MFSAGVGRTGTYITLDTMLERMQHVDNVNVYECVKNMRARRVFMVQTQVSHNGIEDDLACLLYCIDVMCVHVYTVTQSSYIIQLCFN